MDAYEENAVLLRGIVASVKGGNLASGGDAASTWSQEPSPGPRMFGLLHLGVVVLTHEKRGSQGMRATRRAVCLSSRLWHCSDHDMSHSWSIGSPLAQRTGKGSSTTMANAIVGFDRG